jgi:thioredoxin-related protein
MRFLLITLLSCLLISTGTWETDFEKAEHLAQSQHKFILLNFSGSDWCGPCIRMHKEIFESNAFTEYAVENLILVNADFPRLKKNQLSKEQQKRNDRLAEQYNGKGVFPLTVLLNASGAVIKTWEGFPSDSPGEFTNNVKALVDANK